MTTPANLTLDLEWPSGRSGPAGKALMASLKNLDDLGRILTLFLLEGSHTTLRGSRSRRFQTPQNSGLLGARPVLTAAPKALSGAHTPRVNFYNANRSIGCAIGGLTRHVACTLLGRA